MNLSSLSRPMRARSLARCCVLALALSTGVASSPAIADPAEWTTQVAQVRLLLTSGDAGGAQAAAEAALVDGERRFGADHVRLVEVLNLLGDSQRALEAPAAALPAYQRSADLLVKAGKSVSSEMADTVAKIATARLDQDDIAAAADDFARLVDLRDLLPGAPPAALADAFLHLGYCQARLKHHVVASLFYARALDVDRLAPEPRVQVTAMTALGALHRQRERLAEAMTWYRQALAVQEKWLGIRHPELAQTWTAIGLVLEDQAKDGDAEAAYQRAVAIADAAGPRGRRPLQDGLTRLQAFYQERGQAAKAAGIADRLARLPAP